jgi:hypothetical protein
MSKDYNGHGIQIMATEESDQWSVIIRCDNCRKHFVIERVDFAEQGSMMFVEAEVQMHAAGVDDGWHDGIGFATEDDL